MAVERQPASLRRMMAQIADERSAYGVAILLRKKERVAQPVDMARPGFRDGRFFGQPAARPPVENERGRRSTWPKGDWINLLPRGGHHGV